MGFQVLDANGNSACQTHIMTPQCLIISSFGMPKPTVDNNIETNLEGMSPVSFSEGDSNVYAQSNKHRAAWQLRMLSMLA